MKHSPGPWKVEIENGDVCVVADEYCVCGVGDDIRVNVANAHLIAVAPDLLDLVTSFEGMLAEMDKGEIIVGESGTPAILERVRSTLAKARP